MTANCDGCGQTHNTDTAIPLHGNQYCVNCYNAILKEGARRGDDDDHLDEDDGDDHDGHDPDDE